MTPRQSQALKFVQDFWEKEGYAPSYDEIRIALGAKSKSSIASLINRLESRGWLTKTRGLARSIRLTDGSLGGEMSSDIPSPPTQNSSEQVPWDA